MKRLRAMKLPKQTNPPIFMRGQAQFQYLRDWVLPYLERTRPNELRIWCADGGAGADPYTLAMLIADYFAEDKPSWRIRITATESSGLALGEAERGVYANENLVLLPPQWIGRYFRPVSAFESAVTDPVKADVRFAACPLHMEAVPGSLPFDIVLCRNMLSECMDRERLVRLLHAATAEGGYLVIGPTETLSPRSSGSFHCEMPSIYRKRGAERSAVPSRPLSIF
ncbi:CheR family methyltransferase [Cohnella zeiphila]|uniref:CheR-type methyltransferase domain-containing protein n=1 Tax=Cohnella zeiphila TaxID=2761120 RepID=A0A7X0STT5_9BACL|nr:CheR family methyltransferase [Cohnella zeiphila]MBB6736007.1 hypothetical protein [Cohnella zeiphila]